MPRLTASHVAPILAAALAATAPYTQAAPPDTPVLVIVKVPKPWYAPRALVLSKMRDTIPEYERLPGLVHKAFSFAQPGGEYGGIYLWASADAARAWFNPAWFERVQRERGVAAQMRLFDAPVVLDNAAATEVSEGDAVATLVSLRAPTGSTRQQLIDGFNAALPTYRAVPGLLRKVFTLTDDGRFGGLYLWADAASALQWFSSAWHQRVQQTYGAPAVIEWFDTPILLPSRDAAHRIDTAR